MRSETTVAFLIWHAYLIWQEMDSKSGLAHTWYGQAIQTRAKAVDGQMQQVSKFSKYK